MSENKEKVFSNTVINWYPGHMHSARKKIIDELKNIDIIYEIVDARIPFSSKIKDIDSIIKNKKRILIMNKKDLCDFEVTKKWANYYEKQGLNVLIIDLKNENDYKKIIDLTNEMVSDIQSKRMDKNLLKKEVMALVIGIPNVGKSTLINKLAHKKSVQVENRAGVTKQLNYIKTDIGITILDTPGILWPKLDDQNVALNIAITGGIRKEVLNLDEVVVHALQILHARYPKVLSEKYNINTGDIMKMYEIIAKKIGAYKNNEILYDKVSEKVYNDIVGGVIKGVTYDEWKQTY